MLYNLSITQTVFFFKFSVAFEKQPQRSMKNETNLCLYRCVIYRSRANCFAEIVEVTEIEDNKGGVYKAVELEEGGKFFHDRDYTITNIPKEFRGLTQVSTSADCPGGQDYRLTFTIDRFGLCLPSMG